MEFITKMSSGYMESFAGNNAWGLKQGGILGVYYSLKMLLYIFAYSIFYVYLYSYGILCSITRVILNC